MKYTISAPIPSSQILEIHLELYCREREKIQLQLPSWRPGRYEIANYAQYIKGLEVFGPNGKIASQKQTKDLWTFRATEHGNYSISYTYHAAQLDAGGSWVAPDQVYLNFINLCFAIPKKTGERIRVVMNVPEDYQIACALPQEANNTLIAANFQELVDSPLLAAARLHHKTYQVKATTFHIWIHGKVAFDWSLLLKEFAGFTEKQMDDFMEFPAANYHFLIHLLPFPHYHGVEHQFSTVITLGPDSLFSRQEGMDRLMGISSHELYHFWNVCRIRPKAIQPYDFSREAYLKEGLIAEGVTTFMGDFYLLKSGYYSPERYFEVLEKLMARSFESLGWGNQSIVDSSWDLWLDGYKAGVPDKKVSIYTHGALLVLAMDIMLMKGGQRMHGVMKIMWERFGKNDRGYELKDFEQAVISLATDKKEMQQFFAAYVRGKGDLLSLLRVLLPQIGLKLDVLSPKSSLKGTFGIVADAKGCLLKIHPKSPAYEKLMLKDKILSYASTSDGLQLQISRWGETMAVSLPSSESFYYVDYKITLSGNASDFAEFINL
jgi:predicted metalloprotease with PDZ domain